MSALGALLPVKEIDVGLSKAVCGVPNQILSEFESIYKSQFAAMLDMSRFAAMLNIMATITDTRAVSVKKDAEKEYIGINPEALKAGTFYRVHYDDEDYLIRKSTDDKIEFFEVN